MLRRQPQAVRGVSEYFGLQGVAREPLIQLNVDEMGHNAQRLWAGAGLQPQVNERSISDAPTVACTVATEAGYRVEDQGAPEVVDVVYFVPVTAKLWLDS